MLSVHSVHSLFTPSQFPETFDFYRLCLYPFHHVCEPPIYYTLDCTQNTINKTNVAFRKYEEEKKRREKEARSARGFKTKGSVCNNRTQMRAEMKC